MGGNWTEWVRVVSWLVVVLVEWWRKLKNKQDSILSLYNSRRCVCVYCSNFVDIIQFWLLWHNGLKNGTFFSWYGTRRKFWPNSNSIYNAAKFLKFLKRTVFWQLTVELIFHFSSPCNHPPAFYFANDQLVPANFEAPKLQ